MEVLWVECLSIGSVTDVHEALILASRSDRQENDRNPGWHGRSVEFGGTADSSQNHEADRVSVCVSE